MTPLYQVSLGGFAGADITGHFSGRNVELTVVDATGIESDSAEITIADPTAEVDPPRRGAVLAISLGYVETGLVPMGLFKVDSVTFKGYPHLIVIAAKAADNKESLKERRIKDYTGKTFGAIVAEVAGRHGLTPRVAGELAAIKFPTFSAEESYIGQHEESDIAFVTRLADRLGALATVKQGNLVVVPQGEGESVSGAAGWITLTPDLLVSHDGYEVTFRDKPVHGQVEASYFDRGKVKREPVKVGDGEVAYRFREPLPSKEQAQKAAEAKQRALQRAEGSAKFTCLGDPTIRAGMRVLATGIRSGVDGLYWADRVEHNLGGERPFITKLESNTHKGGGAGGTDWTKANW